MYTDLPYLYDGEILEVQENMGTLQRNNIVRYRVLVTLRDDSKIICHGAEECTLFGGVTDYLQRRARTSKDSGDSFEISPDDDKNDARVGDRVLIMFAGGHVEQPRIVGWRQHPNQTKEYNDPAKLTAQAILQLLGVRIALNDQGELQIMHRGMPKVTPAKGAGADATDTGAETGPVSAAAEYPDGDELTTLELLSGGVFRVRDADGQMIEIDRTKKRVYLSNNDLKSSEDPALPPASGGNQAEGNSTDAEYLLLDKDKQLVLINARKALSLYSFGDRRDTAEGKRTDKVGKDWTVTVAGNVSIEGSGGAKMTLSEGKVALGGTLGELLAEVEKLAQAVIDDSKAASLHTHPTAVGPTGPPTTSASFTAVTSAATAIKKIVGSIKGKI